MKQLMQRALLLGCAVSLLVVSVAGAQSVPQPVVRMGDWVEIGDDAFMNIIGNIDIRFNTTHNSDFEDDVQDITSTDNPTSSSLFIGQGDFMEAEIRFGADFRYKKKLRTRILFETQSVFDGNLIDDGGNSNNPAQRDGTPGGPRGNSPHVERFWIDYKWNSMIRTRVGADLWKQDHFGLLGDDDPSFAVYITPNKSMEFVARYVIQSESTRIRLTNDNDDSYYAFGVNYKGMKGHSFRLDGAYQRWRFSGNEHADTFLITPSWKGTVGIIKATASAAFVFGEVDGTGGENYDVFGYAFMANVVANLGSVRPWIGFVFGSADDDVTDNDLNGFHHLPQREISLGSSAFEWGLTSPSMADYGPSAGANAPIGGGVTGHSTTGNMFLDRLGTTGPAARHPGTAVAYNNAGTLRIAAGAHFTPMKGHRVTGYYQYVGFVDDEVLGGNIDNTLYHEITGVWAWTLSKHFDIRAIANFFVPGDGTKDLAATVTTCGDGTEACKGEDLSFRGTLRFRARF